MPRGLSVTVREGYITLAGTVEWMFQRAAAERAIKYLRGVRGVVNQIVIKPTVSPLEVQKRIRRRCTGMRPSTPVGSTPTPMAAE